MTNINSYTNFYYKFLIKACFAIMPCFIYQPNLDNAHVAMLDGATEI